MVEEIYNLREVVIGYSPIFVREYIESIEREQDIRDFRRFSDRLTPEVDIMKRDMYDRIS